MHIDTLTLTILTILAVVLLGGIASALTWLNRQQTRQRIFQIILQNQLSEIKEDLDHHSGHSALRMDQLQKTAEGHQRTVLALTAQGERASALIQSHQDAQRVLQNRLKEVQADLLGHNASIHDLTDAHHQSHEELTRVDALAHGALLLAEDNKSNLSDTENRQAAIAREIDQTRVQVEDEISQKLSAEITDLDTSISRLAEEGKETRKQLDQWQEVEADRHGKHAEKLKLLESLALKIRDEIDQQVQRSTELSKFQKKLGADMKIAELKGRENLESLALKIRDEIDQQVQKSAELTKSQEKLGADMKIAELKGRENLESLALKIRDEIDQQVQKSAELTKSQEKLGADMKVAELKGRENLESLDSSVEKKADLEKLIESQKRVDELKAQVESLQNRTEFLSYNDDLNRIGIYQPKSKLPDAHAEKGKHNGTLLSKVGVSNAMIHQGFRRQLRAVDMRILETNWYDKLGVNYPRSAIGYLAEKICLMEHKCFGRYAVNIEDAVLRVLLAKSLLSRGEDIRLIEIGALFGVNVAALHLATVGSGSRFHATVIDPLDGYYGSETPVDKRTGIPVNESIFQLNMQSSGIHEDEVELIKFKSTTKTAKKRAAERFYNYFIIDGDHTYKGVKYDFVHYSDLLESGGYLLFDDYDTTEWPDVKKFVNRTMMKHADYDFVGANWRTAIFRKK